jgi:hypothetical protein
VKNKVNEYFVTLKRGNKVVFYKGEWGDIEGLLIEQMSTTRDGGKARG